MRSTAIFAAVGKALAALLFLTFTNGCGKADSTNKPIDRKAVVERNNPHLTAVDTLGSLSVGNGEFAVTVDVTGMQTYPQEYSKGVPLGTMAQWGWHYFPNTEGYKVEESFKEYDFGHGHKEVYACQFKEDGRQKQASNYWRANPHRLHLGIVGFNNIGESLDGLTDIDQTLNLWTGSIESNFSRSDGKHATVITMCHPVLDAVAYNVAANWQPEFKIDFPYPTGGHSDDGCRWDMDDKHTTVVERTGQTAVFRRTLDNDTYYMYLTWEDGGALEEKSPNHWVLKTEGDTQRIVCFFSRDVPAVKPPTFFEVEKQSRESWQAFWSRGAAIDFGQCADPRARELERRIILSEYLLAIQSAGSVPPQETGLTYNSWFGKFHLEMIWWHEAWLALWGHPEKLEKTLRWYLSAYPAAKEIAKRQGFDGVRWMKMTDPSAIEAPSNVGSFLIWQQPHLIYLAELVFRATEDAAVIDRYGELVEETARFMYSFATYNDTRDRYELKGAIPAQETLRAAETVNPPFELSYWHFALSVAQQWRERRGLEPNRDWDTLIQKLSPLAYNEDNLYLAAETATETYNDIRFTSDHMAVLGAVGILPKSRLVKGDIMMNTFNWIWKNWNWDKTWGWDYPMTAMCAARLGHPEEAVGALLMDKRTNTYLVNGHNFQDGRLRCYLPGNGGLLTAVALMTAGYDGCETKLPGWPQGWNVRYEGILPLP